MCVEFQVGKQIGRCEPTHGTQAELLVGLESGGPSLRDPSFGSCCSGQIKLDPQCRFNKRRFIN